MLLLFVGVKEGVEIAEKIKDMEHPIIVASKNKHYEQLINSNLKNKMEIINYNEVSIEQIINQKQPTIVIDATSETCEEVLNAFNKITKKPLYIRYYREEIELPNEPLIKTVYSFNEAVDFISTHDSKNIFLTTGSHNLDVFVKDKRLNNKRIVVRVLPDWKIIKKCQELGVAVKDIVAMQGPFSKRINKAIFRMYNADLIVTRDSGKTGGTDNKISAALELKIPIVVIKRKLPEKYLTATGIDNLLNLVKEIKNKR